MDAASKPPVRERVQRYWQELRPLLAETAMVPLYWVIWGIFAVYTFAAFFTFHSVGFELSFFNYFRAVFQPLGILIFALLYVGWPRGLKDKLARYYRQDLVISGLFLIMIIGSFLSLFLTFKMSIAHIVPFYADDWMVNFERRLHFGHMPWDLIKPLAMHPFVIIITDWLYTLWVLLKVLVVVWQAFSAKDDHVRGTFFLTYLITWILLGTVIAMATSSGGPCYFQYVHAPPNPYAEQMAYLDGLDQQYGLNALFFQHELWKNYVENKGGIINGIAAFPSIHVAVAMMFFLLGRHYGRWATIITGAYFCVILFGSVALAWHYAIDGYFSIIATPLIWFFSSWLIKRYDLLRPRMPKPKSASL